MQRTYFYIAAVVYVLGFCPGPALAAPVKAARTKVELITDTAGIQPGHPFWVGLRMAMDEGWQVYWKNPGDSGLPTGIQWQLPEGFKAGEVHWPFPVRMDYPEVTSYGYEGKVVLLSELTPPDDLDAGTLKDIKADVKWLACGNICIPGEAELSLSLSVLKEAPPIDQAVWREFKKTMADWPLAESDWSVAAYDEGTSFRLRLRPPKGWFLIPEQVAFFPETNDVIDHAARQIFEVASPERYDLVVAKSDIAKENITSLKGVLVCPEGWEDGRRALAADVPVQPITEEE